MPKMDKYPPLLLPVSIAIFVCLFINLVIFAIFREIRQTDEFHALLHEIGPLGVAIFQSFITAIPVCLPLYVWYRQKQKRAAYPRSQDTQMASPMTQSKVVLHAGAPTVAKKLISIDAAASVIAAKPIAMKTKDPLPNAPTIATEINESHEIPEEDSWAQALSEFESSGRRPGVYARAFAEASGDEAAAKAKYLNIRAHELHANHLQLEAARQVEEKQRAAEERRKVEESESDFQKQQRARAAIVWGRCPMCDWFLPLGTTSCPHCDATLGAGAAWDVIPIKVDQRLGLIEQALTKRKQITPRQLSDMVAMAETDFSIVSLPIKGDSLLHKAAEFGLESEVQHLLAIGADSTASNAQGKRPSDVTASEAIKGLLAAAQEQAEPKNAIKPRQEALPKIAWALCPKCHWFTPCNAASCTECNTKFETKEGWKVIPIPDAQILDQLEVKLESNSYVSKHQLADIVRMAEGDHSIVALTIGGDSLLHKAAELGLVPEVERLLALGADPSALNVQGKRPRQLTTSEAVKRLLAAADG
ncbi:MULTISPECIES: hypothetical protein [unclassified Variovorax]|uniref:hypothetical protein n=1 Tax=unclassified Variovorax TaxID=663243 RepID=UPI001BD4D4EB|nr:MULTISPECIES: hypothetical protein [unclassified Variovorax]